MAARVTRKSAPNRHPGAGAGSLVHAGLDTLDFGFAIFDDALRLVTHNRAFRTLRGYPAPLCRPGTELIEFYRYNARRGDYGPGDVELHAQSRLVRIRARQPHELEYTTSAGQVLLVRYTPIEQGGLVLTYADISARKQAERQAEQREAELAVALDNMPGALAYTDEDAATSWCATTASPRCTRCRGSCWSRGRPYRSSCASLRSTATTATATSIRSVAARVESLRNPTGQTFEDRTSDGRVYEVYAAARGGGRDGDGDHGRERPQARGGCARAQGRGAARRPRQHAGRAGLHG